MKRPSRRWAALAIALVLSVLAAACGDDGGTDTATTGAASGSTASTAAKGGPKIVASTSWVGAIAKLAGATDIAIIAPSNIQHPPDYDPKASDLAKLTGADYVLFAGFEGFATRMKEAAGSKAKVETVVTEYDLAKLTAEVNRLAALFGTTAAAKTNLEAYTAAWTKASSATTAKLKGKTPVIEAQAFVAVWAVFAGFTPVGVYGMEKAPSPDEVAAIVKLKPTFIFENSHMRLGTAVVSATGAKKVDLVNFPGDDLDLTKVIATNAQRIEAALG